MSKNTITDNIQSGGSCSVNYYKFKHGVYKLSIYSLYIHLPYTETTEAVANKLQTGQRKHFRKLKFRKLTLFLRVNISG